jgi:hypothetical protein
MTPQPDILPKEAISEGIGELFYLLPLPFILTVLGISIWFGIIKLDGTVLKGYKIYNLIIIVGLSALAHFTIPIDEELKVRDIPTLIMSAVFSGVFIEIFIFWRKKKNEKHK